MATSYEVDTCMDSLCEAFKSDLGEVFNVSYLVTNVLVHVYTCMCVADSFMWWCL